MVSWLKWFREYWAWFHSPAFDYSILKYTDVSQQDRLAIIRRYEESEPPTPLGWKVMGHEGSRPILWWPLAGFFFVVAVVMMTAWFVVAVPILILEKVFRSQ